MNTVRAIYIYIYLYLNMFFLDKLFFQYAQNSICSSDCVLTVVTHQPIEELDFIAAIENDLAIAGMFSLFLCKFKMFSLISVCSHQYAHLLTSGVEICAKKQVLRRDGSAMRLGFDNDLSAWYVLLRNSMCDTSAY